MPASKQPFLDDERGGYAGPVTREEALKAIRSHFGTVVVEYRFAQRETRTASGFVYEAGPSEAGTDVFVLSNREVPVGLGLIYEEATVLDLSFDGWSAEQYTGGLDLTMGRNVVRLV